MSNYILGITGASGSIYATRLAEILAKKEHSVLGVFTETGEKVCKYEKQYTSLASHLTKMYKDKDLFADIASGSFIVEGMVIVPASMGTVGKVANVSGSGLLCRSADVQIKEKKSLIIVPREFPLHSLHLDNLKKLADQGVVILPPSPHFYHHPKTIQDLVDTVVSRILDHLNITHSLSQRWS